jgi:lactoylglutathione lyase
MLEMLQENNMRYLHTMVRIRDIDESLDFYVNKFGLEETRRIENEKGRFTLIFLAAPGDAERAKAERAPTLELTYNWDKEAYTGGRNFGHLAYVVMPASSSTARHATATWLSSRRRMAFPLS